MSDDNHTLPYPEASTEYPTLVIPRGGDDLEATPRTKGRRRWPWVLLIVVVVLALLLVAAEMVARSVLPGVVRSIVIEQLELPVEQQLDVEAEGILLPQLILGRLDELHLATDEVTVEGITGAVDVTAVGVPLRGGDLGGATGTVRIDESQFTSLLAGTELPIDAVTFAEPDVTAVGSLTLFGLRVPLSLTVTPGIAAGDLELTPVSLTVGELVVEAGQVESSLGSLGTQLAQTQRICIADQLPAGISLTALVIEGTEAVIDVVVDGAILSDEKLQEAGVC